MSVPITTEAEQTIPKTLRRTKSVHKLKKVGCMVIFFPSLSWELGSGGEGNEPHVVKTLG